MLKFLRRALAFLAVPALASCATPAQSQQAAVDARPALWQVSDPDTKIYLFGTIHLLPKDHQWQTPALERAIASSDTLVVETVIDNANPQKLGAELVRLGYRNGLPPLVSRVSPDKKGKLQAAIAKTRLPPALFDRMETWAAAFTLLGVQFKELGLHTDAGVETVLKSAFARAGKPVGELETNAEQLGFFDALPEKAQRDLLEGAIETPQAASQDFSKMLRAWSSGDVDAIAATFNEQLRESPELREALLRKRNANWSRRIERMLAVPGTVLVAVGAGHLAGPDSLQTLLESKGYRVQRVQ